MMETIGQELEYPFRDWKGLDDAARHAQKASLVYVAITRALENLTVLLPARTNDAALKALVAAFIRAS